MVLLSPSLASHKLKSRRFGEIIAKLNQFEKQRENKFDML